VTDHPGPSDAAQKLDLMKRMARLRQSLLTTTDRYTREGVQKEIKALTIWIKAIEGGRPD
jgi:hypothetical protein